MNPIRLLAVVLPCAAALTVSAATKPNIIFILADDLGYGDVGCYGQKLIQTPHLDRMAADGMKFTQFYAGSTVCAPSRSVLMTGQHVGRTRVRGNASPEGAGPQMLRAQDVTVAEVLKGAGYTTALIGKWGLGMPGDEGVPNRQGFDHFFGYLSQHHAHNHYPDYLWRNGEKVALPNVVTPVGTAGGGYATKRVQYAGDLFFAEAQAFIEKNTNSPFFLYLALVTPHANNELSKEGGDGQEVPDHGIYAKELWHSSVKGQAAMITRMDKGIGDLLTKLSRLGLAHNTLVLFSSDNGPHKEGGPNYDPDFFDANGPFSGTKRSLTDGGIRVPFLAWWPGQIRAGAVATHVGYFGDFMATAAELAGVKPPRDTQSISFVPTLLERGEQKQHEHLYWEFHEGGTSFAVLLEGRWKGIRLKRRDALLALYDVRTDLVEQHDVAAQNPALVKRIEAILATARSENELWPIKDGPAGGGGKAKK
jgi:arylsulfatase A-like enzyme